MPISPTNVPKNSISLSEVSKTSAFSAQNVSKSIPIAPSGYYIGFGAFTYSGGQLLSGQLIISNTTKS